MSNVDLKPRLLHIYFHEYSGGSTFSEVKLYKEFATPSMEKWLLGVLLTIVSAAGSTMGLILQKIAHVRVNEGSAATTNTSNNNDVNKTDGSGSKICGMPRNKYFVAGFILLVFVPLPFDFVALANAGQSIILPVGTGCTVIFGQILAPIYLNEKLSKLDIAATFLITIGVFISTFTGTHSSPLYTSDRLLYLYTLPPIIITIVFILITAGLCIIYSHSEKQIMMWINTNRTTAVTVPESIKIPLAAYIPSSIGALQIMIFKMVGELTKNTFEGYEETYDACCKPNTTAKMTQTRKIIVNEFVKPTIYIYVILVIGFAIAQLSYLNRGLAKYNAIKFLPTYNTLLLMVGVTCGAIYFQEYDAFHPYWFPIGILFEVCGIFVLSWKADDSEKHSDLTESKFIVQHDAAATDNSQNKTPSPTKSIVSRVLPRSHEKVHPVT